AELNDKKWSPLAAEELISSYKTSREKIDDIKLDDTKIALNERVRLENQKKAMAQDLDKAINELRLERIPTPPGKKANPFVAKIFKAVELVQKQVNKVIIQGSVRDELTSEAKSR